MKHKILLNLVVLFAISKLTFAQYDDYMKVVATPPTTAFVMYADNNGNLYYINHESGYLDLMKYDVAQNKVIKVADNFIDERYQNNTYYNNGLGAIAPTKDGDVVYCITTAGSNHGKADIFKLTCSQDTLEHITSACGDNQWMYWNMSLSPDEKYLYYVSNNIPSGKSVCKIDLATKECSQILDLDAIIGTRDLCFGGINVWDNDSNFYVPVWTYQLNNNNCALLKVHPESGNVSAKLLHFTDDLKETGTRLFPDFRHESCWNAICSSSNGDIYIAISNHYKPQEPSDIHGNVALYKYEPDNNDMILLGNIKSISENVNNWMTGESQYKIHTFLIENSDGKIYGATGDHDPTYFLRGSHLYTIDINTDEVVDYSKTQTFLMNKKLEVIENSNTASTTSGVFIEHYGIKGLALNPRFPEYLYAMTWEMDGGDYLQSYIIRYKIDETVSEVERILASAEEVIAYPNPFVESVNFNLSNFQGHAECILKVFDLYGRLIFNDKFNASTTYTLNMPQNNSSVYFYTIEIGNKIIKGKLVKR